MKCPECKNLVINNNIESYCSKCGFVIEDLPIDQTRCFTNQKMHTLSAGGRNTFYDKRLKNVFLANRQEVLFFDLKKDLVRVSNCLSLSSVIEKYALELLYNVINNRLAVGRDYDVVIGSIIYLSAKKHDKELDTTDIANFSMIPSESLEKYIIKLNKELQLNLNITFSKINKYLTELYNQKILDQESLSWCSKNISLIRNNQISDRLKAILLTFIAITKDNVVLVEDFCKKAEINQEHFLKAYYQIIKEIGV